MTIQVDSSIINTKFIHPEERYSNILLVKVDNFHKYIRTIDFLLRQLNAIIQ